MCSNWSITYSLYPNKITYQMAVNKSHSISICKQPWSKSSIHQNYPSIFISIFCNQSILNHWGTNISIWANTINYFQNKKKIFLIIIKKNISHFICSRLNPKDISICFHFSDLRGFHFFMSFAQQALKGENYCHLYVVTQREPGGVQLFIIDNG